MQASFLDPVWASGPECGGGGVLRGPSPMLPWQPSSQEGGGQVRVDHVVIQSFARAPPAVAGGPDPGAGPRGSAASPSRTSSPPRPPATGTSSTCCRPWRGQGRPYRPRRRQGNPRNTPILVGGGVPPLPPHTKPFCIFWGASFFWSNFFVRCCGGWGTSRDGSNPPPRPSHTALGLARLAKDGQRPVEGNGPLTNPPPD